MIPIPYALKGSCTHCGVCCNTLIDIRMRKNKQKDNACKFIFKVDDKFYCRIMSSDISLFDLTNFELEFYNSQCKPYPDPNDESHWKNLPKECTYWRKLIDSNSTLY